MFKKLAAIILAIALVAAMWIIPAQASDFSNVPFFNVDFNSESIDDLAGGVEGREWYMVEDVGATSSATPLKAVFRDDAEIGRKVLYFNQESAIFYSDFDYSKIQNNFTLEAYVKLPKRMPVSGWGIIAGSYWNANPDSGIGITYGQHMAAQVGASNKFNVLQGDGTRSYTTFTGTRTQETWMHLVYTHDGVNEAYYENGVLIASQPVQQASIPSVKSEIIGFRIGGYNMVSQFCTRMDCAYVRVYDSAAAEADVAALYENRNGDAPVVTEVPTETPISGVTPTPAPTPDSNLPVLPEGSAYKVVADDAPAFKKGDTVDITFKITDIEDAKGLMGVDLDIAYDYTLLQPVLNANGKPVVKSSASEIMEKYENSKWTATSRLDGEDTDTPTYVLKMFSDAETDAEEPQIDVAVKGDGELWFTISFEALADGTPDALLAYTVSADGTDSDINSIKGTGVHAFVASGDQPTPPVTDEKPTEVPTDVPTEQPTGQPTEKPTDGGNQKPGNTVTFDAGLVSLAAVALSSVVAAKKRRF